NQNRHVFNVQILEQLFHFQVLNFQIRAELRFGLELDFQFLDVGTAGLTGQPDDVTGDHLEVGGDVPLTLSDYELIDFNVAHVELRIEFVAFTFAHLHSEIHLGVTAQTGNARFYEEHLLPYVQVAKL